eukprot:Rhum_TRINITY_DN15293_c2_g3::Rhum_TRINITY_DN15293_c2_g3_i3::g.149059::m.149059
MFESRMKGKEEAGGGGGGGRRREAHIYKKNTTSLVEKTLARFFFTHKLGYVVLLCVFQKRAHHVEWGRGGGVRGGKWGGVDGGYAQRQPLGGGCNDFGGNGSGDNDGRQSGRGGARDDVEGHGPGNKVRGNEKPQHRNFVARQQVRDGCAGGEQVAVLLREGAQAQQVVQFRRATASTRGPVVVGGGGQRTKQLVPLHADEGHQRFSGARDARVREARAYEHFAHGVPVRIRVRPGRRRVERVFVGLRSDHVLHADERKAAVLKRQLASRVCGGVGQLVACESGVSRDELHGDTAVPLERERAQLLPHLILELFGSGGGATA